MREFLRRFHVHTITHFMVGFQLSAHYLIIDLGWVGGGVRYCLCPQETDDITAIEFSNDNPDQS